MIRRTPFHSRTSAANATGLWSHWSGYLSAEKYQLSEKFEYFAIRNSAALIDTSPLFKYQFTGPDAERYLAGVLTRDIRKCQVGQAQYTIWCDDSGWVLEDGVVFRLAGDHYLLTAARANLAYFQDLMGSLRVSIEDVTDEYAALAVQGPRSREVLDAAGADVEPLGYFRVTDTKIGDSSVTISRTGYTGDLGYEVWIREDQAIAVWDAVSDAGAALGAIPVGQMAMLTARIEAGLVLIDEDFHSARFSWNDDQRFSPLELGMGWMLRGLEVDDRAFIGRASIEAEKANGTSRWKSAGVMVDWRDWDRVFGERGLIPPKDHIADTSGRMLYDGDLNQVGYVTSFVYSPMMQRHIGIGRVERDHHGPISLEVTIDHRYDVVAAEMTKLPFYNPARKTAS